MLGKKYVYAIGYWDRTDSSCFLVWGNRKFSEKELQRIVLKRIKDVLDRIPSGTLKTDIERYGIGSFIGNCDDGASIRFIETLEKEGLYLIEPDIECRPWTSLEHRGHKIDAFDIRIKKLVMSYIKTKK